MERAKKISVNSHEDNKTLMHPFKCKLNVVCLDHSGYSHFEEREISICIRTPTMAMNFSPTTVFEG